ncbi:MAG: response regulator [Deltaproteobacteria bacterium]|nr:response regulator [Deltaproteobacteria bacterium]
MGCRSREKRILIVDKDESDRLLFAKVLRRAGYEVLEAESEAEASSILSRKRCDAVLAEIGTTADGWKLVATLRSVQPLPVIAVAADVSADSEAARAGCDLCLEKPVDIRRLPWRVGSVLMMRRRPLGTGTVFEARAC